MTTLTPEQWRVLTYIQHYTQRWQSAPKLADIRSGCGFESKSETLRELQSLQGLGLVSLRLHRQNGSSQWSVKGEGATVGVMP